MIYSMKIAKLTSYSTMNVNFAADILSSSASKLSSTYGSPKGAGTAEFCLMYICFDIMNNHNTNSHN